jgi:hypothetical protein
VGPAVHGALLLGARVGAAVVLGQPHERPPRGAGVEHDGPAVAHDGHVHGRHAGVLAHDGPFADRPFAGGGGDLDRVQRGLAERARWRHPGEPRGGGRRGALLLLLRLHGRRLLLRAVEGVLEVVALGARAEDVEYVEERLAGGGQQEDGHGEGRGAGPHHRGGGEVEELVSPFPPACFRDRPG